MWFCMWFITNVVDMVEKQETDSDNKRQHQVEESQEGWILI